MNTPEQALLLSLHPRFATAILNGEKTVELRRQRVAVPPGTPVIIYATSPTMALTGTARLIDVDTAAPGGIWRRHRTACGISRSEYTAYMEGASQASALLLGSPVRWPARCPLTTCAPPAPSTPRRATATSPRRPCGNWWPDTKPPTSSSTGCLLAPPLPPQPEPVSRPDSLRSTVLTASAPLR